MNVFTYCRVSTMAQEYASQKLELSNYTASHGMTIISEYEDTISGTKSARAAISKAEGRQP